MRRATGSGRRKRSSRRQSRESTGDPGRRPSALLVAGDAEIHRRVENRREFQTAVQCAALVRIRRGRTAVGRLEIGLDGAADGFIANDDKSHGCMKPTEGAWCAAFNTRARTASGMG